MNRKLELLDRVYRVFHENTLSLETACERHCADCCTANVTMTTLEGFFMLDYLEKNLPDWPSFFEKPPVKRFIPTYTINEIAVRCAEDLDIREEEMDPAAGTCPFLSEDLCTVYPVRPFLCRAMLSFEKCAQAGYARIDEYTVSAAEAAMQYIEHIDMPGGFGNLWDIMSYFIPGGNRLRYEEGRFTATGSPRLNRSVTVRMTPPEYRSRIRKMIEDFSGE